MTRCTICGELLLGMHHRDNACCGSCYVLNLGGNPQASPSFVVYDAAQGPPLLLQAARLECQESRALGQWMDAHIPEPAPTFIPYEERHMVQAIESVAEARARLIAQVDRARPDTPPAAPRPLP